MAAVGGLAEALAGTSATKRPGLSSAIDSLDRVRRQWTSAIRVYERCCPALPKTLRFMLRWERSTWTAIGSTMLFGSSRQPAALTRARRRLPAFRPRRLANRQKEAAQALIDASSRDGSNPLTFLWSGAATDQGRPGRSGQRRAPNVPGIAAEAIDRPRRKRIAGPVRTCGACCDRRPAPIFPLHRYRQAFAWLFEGNYEQAVAELKRAAIGDPLGADSTASSKAVAEAGTLLRRGQLPLALSRLEAALTVAPNRSEAHRMLGVAYWADGQYDKSVTELSAAIRLVPDDERSRPALADVLVDVGRLAEAEQALNATVQAIPASGPAHYRLGQLYQIQSLLPPAVRELETAVALGPLVGLDRLYETIGGLYVNQANFDGAVDAYVKRVDVNPNNADAHRKLGEIYFLQGRDDEALAEFAAALLIDPTSSAALAAACQVYVRMGRFAEALDTSRQALALDAAHNEARYALATSLLRLGQIDEGRKQLEIFQRTQSAAMANTQRQSALKATLREATLRLGNERAPRSGGAAERLAEDPNAAGVQRDLGIAPMKSAQYAEAIQALDKARQVEDSAEVHQLLADAYRALGRPGESEAHAALSAQAIERAKEARLRKIPGSR